MYHHNKVLQHPSIPFVFIMVILRIRLLVSVPEKRDIPSPVQYRLCQIYPSSSSLFLWWSSSDINVHDPICSLRLSRDSRDCSRRINGDNRTRKKNVLFLPHSYYFSTTFRIRINMIHICCSMRYAYILGEGAIILIKTGCHVTCVKYWKLGKKRQEWLYMTTWIE